MNTSPVRMDDLPLNGFHCRIAALTFGAHLVDGYVLGVIGYAIIQLTPAMQLTPLMAGMIGGAALLGLFIGSLILGWVSDHIGRQKIFNFSFMLITVASFLQFFATTPEQLIGLRILIGIGTGAITPWATRCWLNLHHADIEGFCSAHSAWCGPLVMCWQVWLVIILLAKTRMPGDGCWPRRLCRRY